MPFAQPVNPYVEYDPRESFVSVRECAEVLNIGRNGCVNSPAAGRSGRGESWCSPALIPGYTARLSPAAPGGEVPRVSGSPGGAA